MGGSAGNRVHPPLDPSGAAGLLRAVGSGGKTCRLKRALLGGFLLDGVSMPEAAQRSVRGPPGTRATRPSVPGPRGQDAHRGADQGQTHTPSGRRKVGPENRLDRTGAEQVQASWIASRLRHICTDLQLNCCYRLFPRPGRDRRAPRLRRPFPPARADSQAPGSVAKCECGVRHRAAAGAGQIKLGGGLLLGQKPLHAPRRSSQVGPSRPLLPVKPGCPAHLG